MRATPGFLEGEVLSDDELQRHELAWPDDVPINFVRSLSIQVDVRPLCLGNARANTRGPTRRDVGRGGSRARTGGVWEARGGIHGPDAGSGRLWGVAATSHRFEARLIAPS